MWYVMAKEQHECLLTERLMRTISDRQLYEYNGDTVENLLEKGVDVNRPDGTVLPLHCCCMVSNIEALNILLRRGANINDVDGYGRGALHYAAEKDPECIQILLKSGADVNIVDANEDTALHWAAVKNKSDCMKVLLESDADVNYLDANSDSPLSWAAFKGKFESIKLLLDYNAVVDTYNYQGMTPLMRCTGIRVIGLNTPDDDSSLDLLIRASGQFDIRCDDGSYPRWLQSDNRTKQLIQEICSSPRSLLELCRYVIRTEIGPAYLPGIVHKLPIPRKLHDFILLRF